MENPGLKHQLLIHSTFLSEISIFVTKRLQVVKFKLV